jgi:hypothetical protein
MPNSAEHDALVEARSLFHATLQGVDVSDCLRLSPTHLSELEKLKCEDPSEAYVVDAAIAFRLRVAQIYEQLMQDKDVEDQAREDEAHREGEVTTCPTPETTLSDLPGEDEDAVTEGEAPETVYE